MKARLVLLSLCLLVAGCGGHGGDASNTKAADDSPSSAFPSELLGGSPTPTAAPTYLENDSCRSGMSPIMDLIFANAVNSLDYGAFENRVNQLTKKIDAAVAPCSKKVNNPIRRTMYDFTLARVQWGIGRCDKACIAKVEDNIKDGLSRAREAQTQLEAVG